MIYSNTQIPSEEREFSFGKLHVIALGEKGRGRQEIVLPCPPKTKIKKGENPDLTIGFSKTGKPKIIPCYQKEETNYYLLSSAGGYTRRGCGDFRILNGYVKKNIFDYGLCDYISQKSNPSLKSYLTKDLHNIVEKCYYLDSNYELIQKYELASGNGADGDAGRIGTWDVTLLQFPSAQDITIKIYYSGGGDKVLYIQQNKGIIQSFFPEELYHYDGELNFVPKDRIRDLYKKVQTEYERINDLNHQHYSENHFVNLIKIIDEHNKSIDSEEVTK